MQHLDLTLASAAENLACDEALLDLCEEGYPREILRFWESPSYFVVAGYSNKIHQEVDINSCRDRQIPIYRRVSGGGTVLQGPGCLNFALILKIDSKRPISNLVAANHYVLEQNRTALEPLLAAPAAIEGISDLTQDRLKFSGNAQRRRRHFMLFHGTLLLDFDLGMIQKTLRLPSRQPDYRNNRTHEAFLINLKLERAAVKEALRRQWQADEPFPAEAFPADAIRHLVETQYRHESWNFKFA